MTELLERLRGLIDKHLIYSAEQEDGEPRFDMLVTIRAYASGRLVQSGQAEATARRHAAYFLCLAEEGERRLAGPHQRQWLDRLDREYDNLLVAIRWAAARGEPDIAWRLCGALWFFFDMRGHLKDGRELLDEVLALSDGEGPTAGQVRALHAAGWLALVAGDYTSSVCFQERSLTGATKLGDAGLLARSRMFLALALGLGPREYDRALELYAASLPAGRQLGDLWTIGLALYGQGHVAAMRGDMPTVQALWDECFAVCQDVRSLYALSYLQFRRGLLAIVAGNTAEAEHYLVQAAQLGFEVDSTREMGVALDALAWVAAAHGQPRRAARLFGVAESLLEQAGYNVPPFMEDAHQRALASVRHRLRPAAMAAEWHAGRLLTPEQAVAYIHGDGELLGRRRTRGQDEPGHAPLSAREWDVVRLLPFGLTNREIGEQLSITERTVGAHLEHAYAKLHIETRPLLTLWSARAQNRDALPVAPFDLTGARQGNDRRSVVS
jgi:non-specific serine/threonine protein kinase